MNPYSLLNDVVENATISVKIQPLTLGCCVMYNNLATYKPFCNKLVRNFVQGATSTGKIAFGRD